MENTLSNDCGHCGMRFYCFKCAINSLVAATMVGQLYRVYREYNLSKGGELSYCSVCKSAFPLSDVVVLIGVECEQ